MPYHVEWYDKPHIVNVKLYGNLTEEETRGFADALIALAQEVPDARVHSIVDVTELTALPPITVLAAEMSRMLKAYPNRDMSTMYGVNTVVRYMVEMLVKLTPLRMRIFNTREEAEAFVRQMVTAHETGEDAE